MHISTFYPLPKRILKAPNAYKSNTTKVPTPGYPSIRPQAETNRPVSTT